MPEISNIRGYSDNRWFVWYKVLAACGCYKISRVMKIVSVKKPTDKQVEKAIAEHEEKLKAI